MDWSAPPPALYDLLARLGEEVALRARLGEVSCDYSDYSLIHIAVGSKRFIQRLWVPTTAIIAVRGIHPIMTSGGA